jgi:hypothetical protein
MTKERSFDFAQDDKERDSRLPDGESGQVAGMTGRDCFSRKLSRDQDDDGRVRNNRDQDDEDDDAG